MERISHQEVISRYETIEDIWPLEDSWHSYTHKVMHGVVKNWVLGSHHDSGKILNIGSGGASYGLPTLDITHTDLCGRRLPTGSSVVCNAEQLPFPDGMFDVTICVGSVLNYCDALAVISEISRVTRANGRLILEFEKSDSFEYLRSKVFCKNATIVTTFYAGEKERIWVFNEKYVLSLLASMHFRVRRRKPIHLLSSALSLLLPIQIAAKFGFLDWIAASVPFLNRFASNVILECDRVSGTSAQLP